MMLAHLHTCTATTREGTAPSWHNTRTFWLILVALRIIPSLQARPPVVSHIIAPVCSASKKLQNIVQALMMTQHHPALQGARRQFALQRKLRLFTHHSKWIPVLKIDLLDARKYMSFNKQCFPNHQPVTTEQAGGYKVGSGAHLELDLMNIFDLHIDKKASFEVKSQYYDMLHTQYRLYEKVVELYIQVAFAQQFIRLYTQQENDLKKLKTTAEAELKAGHADAASVAQVDADLADCMFKRQRKISEQTLALGHLKTFTGASDVVSELPWMQPDLSYLQHADVMRCVDTHPAIQNALWHERKHQQSLNGFSSKSLNIKLGIGVAYPYNSSKRAERDKFAQTNIVQERVLSNDITFSISKNFGGDQQVKRLEHRKDYEKHVSETRQKRLEMRDKAEGLWDSYLSAEHIVHAAHLLLEAMKKQDEVMKKSYAAGVYSFKEVLQAKKQLYGAQQQMWDAQKEQQQAAWGLLLFVRHTKSPAAVSKNHPMKHTPSMTALLEEPRISVTTASRSAAFLNLRPYVTLNKPRTTASRPVASLD